MDQVLRSRTDFPKVRSIASPLVGCNHQVLLLHQALRNFLGDVQLASAECSAHSHVNASNGDCFGTSRHSIVGIGILVRPLEPCTVIEVSAAGQVQVGQ
jgi:hypothetical protein